MISPLTAILQVLFPTSCVCCGDILVAGEKMICVNCLTQLEKTHFAPIFDNPVERLLIGRIPFEAATATYYFRRNNPVRSVVHAMKFHSCPELCLPMGRQMAFDLIGSGRFDDIDVIVPVPLHWVRRLRRGYNQSELLCRGIAEVMHRPIENGVLIRHRYTPKQSQQTGDRRVENVQDAFRVKHPEQLEGKHILLVDDVLTTGATLAACADALCTVEGLRISVATFCIAH